MRKDFGMKRRIAAVLCVTALALCQVLFVVPETVSAENCSGIPGEVLSVRVQYAGEREDKIREKVSYTVAELESMDAAVYRYTNVTEVGTVMQVIAYGPPLLDIINDAGVDINSIKMITFKTTDGYTRNFSVGEHLTSARYYYPYLPKNYQRNGDAETLIPLEGSLADAQLVPSVLALKCESTKNPVRVLTEEDMKLDEAFRFCLGQPHLEEGLETVPGYDGGHVTSMNSTQFIYAVDLTLYGSPVEGMSLDMDMSDIKVGSEKKISVVIDGDELFADEFADMIDQLTWSSSNPDVISVSEDGTITVLKEGVAVITATAPDGTSASITINASGEGEKDDEVVSGTDTEQEPAEPEEVTPAEPSAEAEPETPEKEEAVEKPTEPSTEPEPEPSTEPQTPEESENQHQTEADGDNRTDAPADSQGDDDNDRDNKDKDDKKEPDKEDEKEPENVESITVKEVTVEEFVPENAGIEDAMREEMAADSQALDKADETNPVTVLLSGYTAVLAAGFGAAFRIRRYFKEV